MTKTKLISRMKKMKTKENLSYQALSDKLGFRSATTSNRYLKYSAIPRNRYEFLDQKLSARGY